jgi:rod shape-determining protein MreB
MNKRGGVFSEKFYVKMKNMLDSIFSLLSYDLGIDLGTANTLVTVKGKGIVVNEPCVVARHRDTKEVLAIGKEAKEMVGKTPGKIEIIYPLRNGVIADLDATEEMLKKYIRFLHDVPGIIPKVPKPRVVIGIPSGITEVERRAVHEAALHAGARKAYLVEEPMAAAIGGGLPVNNAEGHLIVDIGGGTTEIAVISLGGIVVDQSLRIAGNKMDEAIISFCRMKHGIILGTPTAEKVKKEVGSAIPFKEEKNYIVRGREMATGLPKSIKLKSSEVREALSPIVQQIFNGVTEIIEETPPELLSDILNHGIVMAGGGSKLYGIDRSLSEETKMPVWRVEDPQSAVVRGCGKLLEDKQLLEKVKIVGGLK